MYDYTTKASLSEQGEKLGGMVRHLKARLEEFDCVTLTICDQETGVVEAEFHGFTPEKIQKTLLDFRGIQVVAGERVTFYLRPTQKHETIDTIWGGIFTLIM